MAQFPGAGACRQDTGPSYDKNRKRSSTKTRESWEQGRQEHSPRWIRMWRREGKEEWRRRWVGERVNVGEQCSEYKEESVTDDCTIVEKIRGMPFEEPCHSGRPYFCLSMVTRIGKGDKTIIEIRRKIETETRSSIVVVNWLNCRKEE